MEWRSAMEMNFEKRRKEIINQLEDIRSQLMNSLEILENFKAQKMREAKAREQGMDQLEEAPKEAGKSFKIQKVSLN